VTDNVKHSTSYFHEVLAKAFEMFKNGYEPVMETPFQPRRQGSAFVVEYKLVRESLDFDEIEQPVIEMTQEQSKRISERGKQARLDKLNQRYDEAEGDVYFFLRLLEKDIEQENVEPLPSELLDRMNALREKAESNRAMEELVEQAQELDMGYEKQLTIQEKWDIDDEINFEADEKKKLAESEDCGKIVYTKEELDELYWTDLQEVGRKFGVKQRDRKKLTKMILEAQSKDEMG